MGSLVKKYSRKGENVEFYWGMTPSKFEREGAEEWRLNDKIEMFTNDALEIYGETNGEEFGIYVGINKKINRFNDQ